jgi:outer membrane protein assembly factor BamB
MSACPQCASPYGPGDRRCTNCGAPRGGELADWQGRVTAAGPAAPPRAELSDWSRPDAPGPIADPGVVVLDDRLDAAPGGPWSADASTDPSVDVEADGAEQADPPGGRRDVRVGRRSVGLVLVMLLAAAVVVGALLPTRHQGAALLSAIETPLAPALRAQPARRWSADLGALVPGSAVTHVVQDAQRVYVEVTARRSFPIATQALAFDAASGAQLWTVPLPSVSVGVTAGVTNLFAVLDGQLVVGTGGDAGLHIRALSPTDGSTRWDVPVVDGEIVPFLARGVLMVLPVASDAIDASTQDAAAGTQLTALDLRDGSTRWQLDTAGLDWAIASDRLVVTLKDGKLQALDLAAGTARWTATVAATAHLVGSGATLLVADDTASTLAAYSIDGVQRWRTDLADLLGGQPIDTVEQLGTGVLLVHAGPGPVIGIDPGRGTVRWSSTGPNSNGNQFVLVRTESAEVFLVADRRGSLSRYDLGNGNAVGDPVVIGGETRLASSLVYVHTSGSTSIDAYDLVTFAKVWSLDVPASTRLVAPGPLLVTSEGTSLVAYR